MSQQRDQRQPASDVVIELDEPGEMFAVDQRGLLDGARRIDTGIDELIDRLLAQKTFDRKQRIVLDVAGECSDEVGANLVESVRRYCELAIRRANRQHDLIWRQGMRSLVSGSLLFVVGIGLSYLFTRPFVGEFAGELFGNGVFLVVAWVGLWYPLDVLFIAREQAKREARALRAILKMQVAVRAHSGNVHATGAPGFPNRPPGGYRSVRLLSSRIRLRGAPPTGAPGAS
ncbi:hypothetical protein BN973_02829 [Mycobacterium numidiamassiliense]|uniref:Transmembrane protein n=1 Tax=Mycobacterium numidiamassiliense TaxID=1841861 RepID=A0A2U3PI76_9MYCO|nr:hypothetical protein [Mycobacterium numidiamassiliense]SPM43365.1 hypothetical protein BN973_02829 [Mycobacterium numidiamassiliense]